MLLNFRQYYDFNRLTFEEDGSEKFDSWKQQPAFLNNATAVEQVQQPSGEFFIYELRRKKFIKYNTQHAHHLIETK